MKGIVFTEFFSMIEESYGYEMVDHLIQSTNLPSQGIYTAVGTYDHSEIVTLLGELHEKTKIPLTQLLQKFGHHLYKVFTSQYSYLVERSSGAFNMLSSIENYIHVEVKKLYPDAQLPHFQIEKKNENHLVMIYTSERKLGHLAFGLIEACLQSYDTKASIDMSVLDEEGKIVRFDIKKII